MDISVIDRNKKISEGGLNSRSRDITVSSLEL